VIETFFVGGVLGACCGWFVAEWIERHNRSAAALAIACGVAIYVVIFR
jgi:fluoride ion exporter CrcB/FEX